MLYAVGVFIPDTFVYLLMGGKRYLVLNDLEIDRVRRRTPHCRVLSLTACQQKLRRAGVHSSSLAPVIGAILGERKIKRVIVPSNFPLGLARELRALKIKVRPKKDSFFPEREIKS